MTNPSLIPNKYHSLSCQPCCANITRQHIFRFQSFCIYIFCKYLQKKTIRAMIIIATNHHRHHHHSFYTNTNNHSGAPQMPFFKWMWSARASTLRLSNRGVRSGPTYTYTCVSVYVCYTRSPVARPHIAQYNKHRKAVRFVHNDHTPYWSRSQSKIKRRRRRRKDRPSRAESNSIMYYVVYT